MSGSPGKCPSGGDGCIESCDGENGVALGRAGGGECEGAPAMVAGGPGPVPHGFDPGLVVDREGGLLGDVQLELVGVGVERDVEVGASGVTTGWG